MSEAEPHQIKMSLGAGKRSKASRGELRWALPAGLERLRAGEVALHPDEEVQARLRLIFDKFRELGSARAVMRYLRHQGLKVPRRLLNGPGPHEIIWTVPTSANVRDILQNPAYAGAYVYGRRKADRARRRPGSPQGAIVRLPIDRWEVCIQDAFPAYITWEEFVANQKRLAANQNDYRQNRRGAATVIGVKASTVHRWLRGGLLDARQSAKGWAWKIRLIEEQISRLREYAQQPLSGRQRKTLLRQLAAGANPK
jgi:hypothetical protein